MATPTNDDKPSKAVVQLPKQKAVRDYFESDLLELLWRAQLGLTTLDHVCLPRPPPSIMFACPDRQRLPHPTDKIGWRYRISNGMHTRAQGSRAFGAPKPDNKPSLLWSLFVGPCEPPRPRSRHDGYHVGPYRGCQVAGPAAGPAAGMIRNPATGPTIAWT